MIPAAKDDPAAQMSLSPPVPLVLGIPHYLRNVYWWAYGHPRAVRLFERDWVVNLILFGNYARLRDAVRARNAPRNARGEALLEAHSLHCPRGLTARGSFIYHAMT